MSRLAKVLPALGILLLLPPAYLTARWIRIAGVVEDHEARVLEFVSIFPPLLQGTLTITLLSLACALGATAAGASGFSWLTGWRRGLCGAIFGVGGLLSVWLFWTVL